MLLELNIKNFAIIDDLNIQLTKGLNILTGETGSGKSVIIEALGIILGGRGNKNSIQKGSDRATLQALFVVEDKNKEILKILNEYGIEINDDKLLLFTREIFLEHPSISRINGRTVTLNVLKEISTNLIDIFAQQEHQSLLDIKNHKKIIDLFGDEEFNLLKKDISLKYKSYKELVEELSEIDIDSVKKEREIELLKYQIDEIKDANIDIESDNLIDEKYLRYKNLSNTVKSLNKTKGIIKNDNYEEASITELIDLAKSSLLEIRNNDKNIEPIYDRIESLDIELNDIYKEISSYVDNSEINEEEEFYIFERFNTMNTLKKKYGNTLEDILEYELEIENDLEKLLNQDMHIQILKDKINSIEMELIELSKELSVKRKAISKILEDKISEELRELNMPDVEFIVDFKSSNKPTNDGIDDIEFLISTNLGTDLKPLTEIVSGGEMSRIMLGFKSILAKHDNIQTMVFDEIDTGISGRTAQIVGEKIYKISKTKQIITITHLPQIAALADSHYVINKSKHNDRVIADIRKLNEEERIYEMARLVGGVDVTQNTINHAKEMLEMAVEFREK